MTTTLIRASQLLEGSESQRWFDAAESAVNKILTNNLADSGELHRIYLNGVVSIAGQLEDYSNLIQALIALYDVCGDAVYLEQAFALADRVIKEFRLIRADAFRSS